MALELEQTLYNADVVRYHRVGELEINGSLAVAVLESFRNREHRELPVAPVIKRKYDFAFSGDPATVFAEAYAAIKALPEWAGAADV